MEFLRRERIKDHWREQRIFFFRALAAAVIAGVLILILVSRLVVLQVLNFEHYSALSLGNRIRIEPVPPIRGLIFDRNGVVLAENLPSYQLELIGEQVQDLEDTLGRLQELALVDDADLVRVRERLARSRKFESIPLRFRLSDEEVARFAVQRQHFPGVEIRARLARHYPLGEQAVHAIGYVGALSDQDLQRLDPTSYAGTSHVGKVGIERAYEDLLHGEVGYRQVLVNAQGRALQVIENNPPVPGMNLHLTLDADLQLAAFEALQDHRGAVVSIDPRDGGILAFVSTPGFDPDQFGAGLSRADFSALNNDPDKPLFNRAMRGNYPPGSTIKPMLALAGLHHRATTPAHSTFCPGFFQLPGHERKYRDWKREGHGNVDLIDAIAESCDVYFYEMALELGIDRLESYLATFGLGQATGIDILGEKAGLLPSRDWKRRNFSKPADQAWFPGETVIAGIGQGFMLTTPLQLAHFSATLAARGARLQPHLLAATEDPVSGARDARLPIPLQSAGSNEPGYWNLVLAAMEEVVHGEKGTARAIAPTNYRMAGKTGTAQVYAIAQEEEYDAEALEERLRDHALFIAYAPVTEPSIAIAVIVENAGSGSSAAAPVARSVFDRYFAGESQ
ncbi:MAG: penicillin-binding protein 2 [Gammaproteobacteria bacterium]|nr:penicillin-binding protein 2 [Gammaproteobacteria bacterium]